MKPILIALALLLSLPAHASVPSGLNSLPLVTITNDRDKDKTVLSILLDRSKRVVGLYSEGGTTRDKHFWLKDVEKPEGVPLVERDGRILITLQGELSRDTQEGRITARYLVNGIFGTREFCEFELRRGSKGWYVRNIYTGKPVSKVHVVTSSVGIQQLKGLCPLGK